MESKVMKFRQNSKLFCAFLTLGYKNIRETEFLIRLLDRLGADVIELGIPFSDPLADGPVIQESSEYALSHGTRPQHALDLVGRLRKSGVKVPIIFFSYFNPILARGVKRIAGELKQAGFDGVLCPDLPPDEQESLEKELAKRGLVQIHLIAPTTRRERMKKILSRSHGFIYYVSRRGVTGIQGSLDKELEAKVRGIKKMTRLPVLVGFGVSSEMQIRQINQVADGVIMGSALIDAIKRFGVRSKRLEAMLERIIRLCHG